MPSANEILKQYWGFDGFKPLQEEIISAVLTRRDALALLPTGGGKSLCFQVPALVLDGLCLVVSPLIALMRDQVKRLNTLGISAASVDSGKGIRELRQILHLAVEGQYKLLYVSPERLQQWMFRDYLYQMDISMIAVDEAHCVSQWGHDFRPDYLKIAEVREIHENVPVLALTASATPIVQNDICEQLQLRQPQVFKQSFSRPNIHYEVRYSENKNADTISELAGCTCGIVYCRSRKLTEQIGEKLNIDGIPAAIYHAGIKAVDRSVAQDEWVGGKVPVMVATTAFGMGIDKPNVRLVMHYDAPEHLEAWYQEVGRAGRDGLPAQAITLYNRVDIDRLIASTDTQFPPESYLRSIYQAVNNFLQLPIGVEPDRYFPFDVNAFCTNFSFEVVPALYALKLLEREGLWTLTESIFAPSTVQFTVSRHILDTLVASNNTVGYIVTGLLRMFNAIFFYPTAIREAYVARKLKVKENELIATLDMLHKMEVLHYNRALEGPKLFFHHARTDSRYLLINMKRINALRERHLERTKAMIKFIRQDSECREKYLLTYFGEHAEADCGHCDVCARKMELTNLSSLREAITNKLTASALGFPELTMGLKQYNKMDISREVRALMDEGRIIFNERRELILRG